MSSLAASLSARLVAASSCDDLGSPPVRCAEDCGSFAEYMTGRVVLADTVPLIDPLFDRDVVPTAWVVVACSLGAPDVDIVSLSTAEEAEAVACRLNSIDDGHDYRVAGI